MSEINSIEINSPSSTTNEDMVNKLLSSGYSSYWRGEYDKAEEFFVRLINNPSTNNTDMAQCYNALGAIAIELKDYDVAIINYHKELEFLEKLNVDQESIIKSCIALGTVYWRKHQYDQALTYHQKALDHQLCLNAYQNHTKVSEINQKIANIYTDKNEYFLAQTYFDKSLKSDEQSLNKNHPKLGKTYANMGAMYYKKCDYQQAFDYFTKARHIWITSLPGNHIYIEFMEKCALDAKLKSESVEDVAQTLQSTTNSTASKYLFLPDRPFPELCKDQWECIIYSAPLNGSGDIYHIMTYLILAQHQKKELPKVCLSYDGTDELRRTSSSMNTYTQVSRSIQFAKSLGFEEQFMEPIYLKTKLGRTNPRHHAMLSYLKENHNQKKSTYYIEQKLLTLLISKYFDEHGRDNTVRILSEAYGKWTINEDIDRTIKQDVMKEINKIPTAKPLFILQYRYSEKASITQNIKIDSLLQLENYLKSKNYKVWYLFVDSRLKKDKIFGTIKNGTNCFPHILHHDDFGKLFHLELLRELTKLKNVKGFIGNTSGCLDIAAFVGHHVLDLHQFNANLNYQDYRIFLQSSFLTTQNYHQDILSDALKKEATHLTGFNQRIMDTHMSIASGWINGNQNTSLFPVGILKTIENACKKKSNKEVSKVDNAGFVDLHQIITWSNEQCIQTPISIFKQLTDVLLQKLANAQREQA